MAPLRLLLYEKAPGTRARTTIAESGGAEGACAAERCAQWLARFHARGPRSGRVFDLNDPLRSLDQVEARLEELGPPLADKASRLLAEIGAAARDLGDSHLCAGHGTRSEEHTSELQSQSNLVCRLLLDKTNYTNCY